MVRRGSIYMYRKHFPNYALRPGAAAGIQLVVLVLAIRVVSVPLLPPPTRASCVIL